MSCNDVFYWPGEKWPWGGGGSEPKVGSGMVL